MYQSSSESRKDPRWTWAKLSGEIRVSVWVLVADLLVALVVFGFWTGPATLPVYVIAGVLMVVATTTGGRLVDKCGGVRVFDGDACHLRVRGIRQRCPAHRDQRTVAYDIVGAMSLLVVFLVIGLFALLV